MLIKIRKFQKKVDFVKRQYGLNNAEIAEIMGLEYSHLFRVFKGDTKPGKKFIKGIEKFCKKFNTSPTEFIFLE